MTSTDLLVDAFGRIDELVAEVLDGIGPELLQRPAEDANPIGWLVWHLTRIQDDHVAGVADRPQVWLKEGWYERFGLPYPAEAHGYGQTAAEVGQFQGVTAEQLLGYHRAVYAQTLDFLEGLKEEDFGRVVDPSYRPPVTLAVRFGQRRRGRPPARRPGRVSAWAAASLTEDRIGRDRAAAYQREANCSIAAVNAAWSWKRKACPASG